MDRSFSDANSSWASLLVEEVHPSHSFDDELEYDGILKSSSRLKMHRDSSPETLTSKSRPSIDTKTFEQVLQVMVQQSASLDNLRTELNHVRLEYREELQARDERVKQNEGRVCSLEADIGRANAEIESLRLECAALEASGLESSELKMMPLEEHGRILRRVEDDARARVELAEAEKSRFALQQKRFQIELAQLRNQVDGRTYPEEVLQAVTTQLQQAVLDSCRNVAESDSTKQALSEAQERISELDERVADATESEEEASKRCADLENELADLTETFNEVQWHLEQTKLKLQSAEERDAVHAREEVDQLMEQVKVLEAACDEASSSTGQLRTSLNESESSRETLANEAERAKQALAEYEKQVSDIQKQQEIGLMDAENLRELLKQAEQERDTAKTSLLEASDKLETVKSEHEQLQTTCHDTTMGLQEAKAQIEQLAEKVHILQQELEKAHSRHSENEGRSKVEELEKSHAASLAEKNSALAEAIAGSNNIRKELDTTNQLLAKNQEKITQLTSEVDKSRKRELSVSQALCEAKVLEGQLRIEITDLQTKIKDRDMGESEATAQLGNARKRLEELEQTKAAGDKAMQSEIDAVKKQHETAQGSIEELQVRLQQANRLQTKTETRLRVTKERLEEYEKRNTEVTASLQKAEQSITAERQQTALLRIATDDASNRLKEVETELGAAVEAKNLASKELTLATRYHKMQVTALEEERDKALSRLKDNELLMQNSSNDQEEVRRKLEELAIFKEKAARSEEAFAKAKNELSRRQNELSNLQERITAGQEELDRMQLMLQEVKKGRTDALRENERIRLQYAESEGNRAEAMLFNEEIEQQKSELEQEKTALEYELQNMRAQLAEVKSHLETAEQAQERLLEEKSSILTQLGKAESKCMKLEAARRQLAAVYGIPVDSPLASPDRPNPPSRVGSITTRSSASLSPSTPSAPMQIADLAGPPAKRVKLTRSAQNWPSLESAASNLSTATTGSSAAHAISLDDAEDTLAPTAKRGKVPRSKKRERKQSGTQPGEIISSPLFVLYESFAKTASWHDKLGRANCGFCVLENASGMRPQHNPLEFDSHLYPAQYWAHCVYYHSVAMRHDLESYLQEEARKDASQSTVDDSREVFTTLVSWKDDNKACVCGLCELRSKCDTSYVRPKVQAPRVWEHFHANHELFWKPGS